MIQYWVVILVTKPCRLPVIIHRYVHVIVPVLGQANIKGKRTIPSNKRRTHLIQWMHFFIRPSKHRYKVRRSPSQIRHLLPTSVLPLKDFTNYDQNSHQLDEYRTSSTIDDSHFLLNHPHQDLISGGAIISDSAYMYDYDFGSVIQSRTQTTLLQHNYGPPELPPLYQPQHRASI